MYVTGIRERFRAFNVNILLIRIASRADLIMTATSLALLETACLI